MELTNMITLSMNHITEGTANFLKADKYETLTVYPKGEYGFFVYLNWNDFRDEDLPEDLWNCLKLARSYNCDMICFDCDATEVDCLDTYEWED